MTTIYSTRAYVNADSAPAFAVVNAVRSDVSERAWNDHVRRLGSDADASGGVLGCTLLVCPRDYIYGLFTHLVRWSLAAGAWLEVDDFCAVPLVERLSGTGILLTAAEDTARRAGCARLSVKLLDDDKDGPDQLSRDALAVGGFRSTSLNWTKAVA